MSLRWSLFPLMLYSEQTFPTLKKSNDLKNKRELQKKLVYLYDKINWYIYIPVYILINYQQTWSTDCYCFISPRIDHTVVFKRGTRHFFTAFPSSCFFPLLDIMRAWFYFSNSYFESLHSVEFTKTCKWCTWITYTLSSKY